MRNGRSKVRLVRIPRLLWIGVAAMVLVSPANAEEKPTDAAALAGLDSVKTVFLVNRDDARTTAGYLKGIRATHESLVQQGVAPSTVLVFLGKAVQFITTQPEESIATEQKEALESIVATMTELDALGIRLEVCSAATKHFEVDNETLLPEMNVVGNGFISSIGWQSKGYVPMTF